MEFLDDKETVNKLLQAQSHVWHCTFNFINSASLKCAVELGIPDIIQSHGQQQPITLSALVAALPINPNKAHCVHRLMRTLVHSGFFALQKIDGNNHQEEGYSLTESSRLLLKDHPFSLASFVLVLNDPILTKPFEHLSSWLQNDDDPTAFSVAHGEPIWNFSGHEPEFGQAFDEVMASDSLLVGHLVTNSRSKVVFEGLESLVDVGGGTGNMGKAIAKAFPEMDCTVLDLPHVVAGLPDTKNMKYVSGDMFQSIPPADAVLLKWILHDWDDDDCVKILQKCKEAIMSEGKGGGKVIIIDMVIGNQKGEKETEAQLFFDMEMMVTVNGRERDEQEWGKLFVNAGFSHYEISPVLGPRALIEVYP